MPNNLDTPWFELTGDDQAAAVSTLIDGYKRDQAGRRERWIRNLELFEGRKLGGYSAHGYYSASPNSDQSAVSDTDRLRLVRSAVATAVSTIYAPQKPKPQFQTLGASWEIRRKAYRLDRICEGLLNQRQGRFTNMWSLFIDSAVDAALQGDSVIKVVADTVRKRITHLQIPAIDLFVDPSEGREPQNLFQREPVDASYARQLWPSAANEIGNAQAYDWYDKGVRPRAAKVVELQYAWRLPFGPDKPGKWCACINGKQVDHGEWTAPAFPFVILQWEPNRDGYWASGIADEGRKLVEDCSVIDLRLFARELLASTKRIYYRPGTCKKEDFELNDATVAIACDADYPQESVTPAFTPQDVEYARMKISQFWDAIGLSQVTAAARRELNLPSAEAQLTVNETKAGRQLIKSQRYEQAFPDLAHQWIWRMRELAEKDKKLTVQWAGKTMMRLETWSDADVEDEMFTVTVPPASALPHDPAGRRQEVQSMIEAGMISKASGRKLINWPDLDSELTIENAEDEYVDLLIERYLDAEQENWDASDYEAPEGFMTNKIGALRRFIAAWYRAKVDQLALPKKERAKAEFPLSLLRQYIGELDLKISPAENAGAAEGPALQGPLATPPGSPVPALPMPPPGPPGTPPFPANGNGIPGAGPVAA